MNMPSNRVAIKKITLAAVFLITFLGWASQGLATPFQDPDFEVENQDAVSRFGARPDRKKHFGLPRVIAPIEPSSFADSERVGSRGPASVSADSNGKKSSVSEAIENGISERVLVRHLKNVQATQDVSVIVNELGFFPSTLMVTQGVPVRLFITGATKKSQCFILESQGVRRQIKAEKIEEVTFVPDAEGVFRFSCPINGAEGKLVVRPLQLDGYRKEVRRPASAGEESVQTTTAKSFISDQDFEE